MKTDTRALDSFSAMIFPLLEAGLLQFSPILSVLRQCDPPGSLHHSAFVWDWVFILSGPSFSHCPYAWHALPVSIFVVVFRVLGVPIYTPVYISSEALMGINIWPDDDKYLLIPRTTFYEFIPIECSDQQQPSTLLLHQVLMADWAMLTTCWTSKAVSSYEASC